MTASDFLIGNKTPHLSSDLNPEVPVEHQQSWRILPRELSSYYREEVGLAASIPPQPDGTAVIWGGRESPAEGAGWRASHPVKGEKLWQQINRGRRRRGAWIKGNAKQP